MSDRPICITIKVPESGKFAGDNPWFVFEGDAHEVAANIRRVFDIEADPDQSIAGLVLAAQASIIAEANAVRGGITSVEAPAYAAPAQPTNVVTPQAWGNTPAAAAAPAASPSGEQCAACGTVIQYKEITARATGKQYKMWACPNQRSKGDGHTSRFV